MAECQMNPCLIAVFDSQNGGRGVGVPANLFSSKVLQAPALLISSQSSLRDPGPGCLPSPLQALLTFLLTDPGCTLTLLAVRGDPRVMMRDPRFGSRGGRRDVRNLQNLAPDNQAAERTKPLYV